MKFPSGFIAELTFPSVLCLSTPYSICPSLSLECSPMFLPPNPKPPFDVQQSLYVLHTHLLHLPTQHQLLRHP